MMLKSQSKINNKITFERYGKPDGFQLQMVLDVCPQAGGVLVLLTTFKSSCFTFKYNNYLLIHEKHAENPGLTLGR